jgi:hypothetical protein
MYLNINSKCTKISVSVDGHNNEFIFNGIGLLTPTSNENCSNDFENMLISFMIIFGLIIFFVFICCYCCCRNRRAKCDQSMMYSGQQNQEKIIDTHV